MKNKLTILLFLPIMALAQNHPIFSEYGEGSSFNKWIEIYNPTQQDIYLDDYRYNFCWNGCDDLQWEFSIPFDTGYILNPGETYLLAHYDADITLVNSANQTTNILSNGNDVCGLYNINSNAIIDIIGVFDSTNMNGGWDIDGVLNATEDHTMIRKTDVCNGNMGDWSLSDGSTMTSQWTVNNIDNFNNINTHNSNCHNTNHIKNLSNPNRDLIEIIDIIGRKTSPETKSILIYIYEDGTVEKRIKLN